MQKTEKFLKNSSENIRNLPWGAIITIVTIIFSVGVFQLSRIDRDIDSIKNTMDRDFTRIFTMFDSMKNDHNELMKETHRETKDFHARLHGLEIRYNKINEEREF